MATGFGIWVSLTGFFGLVFIYLFVYLFIYGIFKCICVIIYFTILFHKL